MLVAAALVPDTALLVPGVCGVHDPVPGLRAAALTAVAAATVSADRVVVVAPAAADGAPRGVLRASLAPVGVPDDLLGWAVPEVPVGGPGDRVVPAVASSVALHLLARTGWAGPVDVVEVARGGTGPRRAVELALRGRASVAGPDDREGAPGRVALVVVGSGSARHGPDAPLADDDRAPAFDTALTRDLADAGPVARARVAGTDPTLAAELAVSGWGPWQVLVGAVGATAVRGRLLGADTVAGAHHLVALWEADHEPVTPVGAP